MEYIGNYKIIEAIEEINGITIYRGQKEGDSQTKIIKLLKAESATHVEIACIKQEYAILKSIDSDKVVKTYGLLPSDLGFALLLEDFNGISLKNWLDKGTVLDIALFLKIAIIIAGTLGHIHEKGIIHRGINPTSILIQPETIQIKITNFGFSTLFTNESPDICNFNAFAGNLAYISPEQTGRMNHSTDYRTDFYSLGVTFYEMLTRKVPFNNNDPLEIIHAHIARQPTEPIALRSDIPQVISQIILKLLSKTADERYQNSFGLMYDLKKCLQQLEVNGKIMDFELAKSDIPVKFIIPQILAGREQSMACLLENFEKTRQGLSQSIFIYGDPGIGKSVLVNEIHRFVAAKKGFYIAGKYEWFRKNFPYSALITAFQGLIRQILMEGEEVIAVWKTAILKALKNNGQVLIDVIPDLERITGTQPPVDSLDSEEAKNRFHMLFKGFVKVIASENHPLVLFLDDLQWVDTASINILEILMSDPQLKYFLLICAYRDKEIPALHPVRLMQPALKKLGIPVHDILLEALDVTAVNKLIHTFLKTDMERTLPLARVVYDKTNGNPFFINQLIKTLSEDKILKFDIEKGWYWEEDKLPSIQCTDNVLELLALKILKLPHHTLDLLKKCACFGSSFEPDILALVLDTSVEDIVFNLKTVVREGLIVNKDNGYQFYHNRIGETTYALLTDMEKKQFHYKIGKILLENTGTDHWLDDIFSLVNHLNHGIDFNLTATERKQLSHLNYLAGHKAKESSAYQSALVYLRIARQLLIADCWQQNYRATFLIYKETLECEYYAGNLPEAENLSQVIFKSVQDKIDLSQVYILLIMLNINKGKLDEAIKLGIRALKMFGVKISTAPSLFDVLWEAIKIRNLFGKRKPESIIDLPDMKDPEKLAIVELLTALTPPASVTNSVLLALTVLKPITYYLKYGNTGSAAWIWAAFASSAVKIFGDYRKGYRIGQAALELDKKYNNRKFKSKLLLTYAYSVLHWQQHARYNLPFLKDAYEYGIETGDIHYAGNSINFAVMTRIMLGHNLKEIFDECKVYENFLKDTAQALALENYKDNRQLYLNLTGKTQNRYTLDSGTYKTDEQLALYQGRNNYLFRIFLLMNILRVQYLFHHYQEALKISGELEKYMPVMQGTLHDPEFYFYHALTVAAVCRECAPGERKKYRKILEKLSKKLKTWANNCPENFLHKYLLVEAERLRITAKVKKEFSSKIIYLYNEAINSAYTNDYVNNAAIANELAAAFFLESGMENIAHIYLTKAYYAYMRWGATAKVMEFEEKYTRLFANKTAKQTVYDTVNAVTHIQPVNTAEALDLYTIIKSSQAISGEIVLSNLLKHMLKIIMENAGAQKGLLLLENKGSFRVEARGELQRGEIIVLESIPCNEYNAMAASVVHYVSRMNQTVLLNNAAEMGDFVNDAYIRENRLKSILAFPIVKQGALFGIVYLENNLTSGAFSADRLELLKIISYQAAISIDNARLYTNLEEKVKERTAALDASNRKLEEAMQALWGELELAKKIQTVLLPPEPVLPGYEIAAYMLPAQNVGGDYYDVINTGKTNYIVIGDVSGHGVTAGLVMMMVQTSIHNTLGQHPKLKPSQLISRVNKTITANLKKLQEKKYITMTVFSEIGQGKFIYSGLHLSLLIYRAKAGIVEQVDTKGMWIGLMDDIAGFNTDRELSLQPGDTLLLYTDGIIEAQLKNIEPETADSDKVLFEMDKLKNMLGELGKAPAGAIIDSLRAELNAHYVWDDDVTLMVVRRL